MKADTSRLPDFLKQYFAYMSTIKGRSKLTVEEYYLDLKVFFQYQLKHKNALDCDYEQIDFASVTLDFVQNITLEDCYNYLLYAASERKNGSAAIARKVSSLRSFFNYMYKKARLISKNPVQELDSPKQKRALPRYLDLGESKHLLDTVEDGKHPERDYCIITLFLNCGMRLSELCGLNLSDYSAENHTLRLLGKGNKERVVYTNEACDEAIAAWLAVRPTVALKDPNAMFVSQKHSRISQKTIQWLLPRYFRSAGMSGRGFSAHKLRHTAATLMYRYGKVDLRVLQEILGHESLATTEIYTHIVSEDMKKAAESNPLAEVKPKKEKRHED